MAGAIQRPWTRERVRALLVWSILVLLAALIASRTPNVRAAAQPL